MYERTVRAAASLDADPAAGADVASGRRATGSVFRGSAVGRTVGADVGASAGSAVGAALGSVLGACVGAGVGATVGTAVGFSVAATVGRAVGAAVGVSVGCGDGVAGSSLGEGEGNGVTLSGVGCCCATCLPLFEPSACASACPRNQPPAMTTIAAIAVAIHALKLLLPPPLPVERRGPLFCGSRRRRRKSSSLIVPAAARRCRRQARVRVPKRFRDCARSTRSPLL